MTHESIQLLYNHLQESSQRWQTNKKAALTGEYQQYCEGRSEAYADAAHLLASLVAVNGVMLEPYIAEENIIS